MMSKKLKIGLIAAIAILLSSSGVLAAVTLTSPEHVTGTPQDRPTPSPTPAPTETPPSAPTAINLSSNISGTFYKGDTLRMTAQLNQPTAGITVTLYNLGSAIANATTDTAGKAVFDRTPQNPFDYHVTATIP